MALHLLFISCSYNMPGSGTLWLHAEGVDVRWITMWPPFMVFKRASTSPEKKKKEAFYEHIIQECFSKIDSSDSEMKAVWSCFKIAPFTPIEFYIIAPSLHTYNITTYAKGLYFLEEVIIIKSKHALNICVYYRILLLQLLYFIKAISHKRQCSQIFSYHNAYCRENCKDLVGCL